MAKTSKIARTKQLQIKSKYSTRVRNRCNLCGRPRGYMRRFGICRICFRGMSHRGLVPGVTKSSW
ncbi:MAG: type Z 30S ribosomal protein S14 [Abitibacteriaceae bacterium]|nr:type Z 30S ribosomal protein S14 [Abditibacteriaceae bacterium]MBV9865961.1 type Z 30S ribosomal protein S14 [Abditibacteriaceae bacterium]